jgi:iron complex transport system substrate-binding protein
VPSVAEQVAAGLQTRLEAVRAKTEHIAYRPRVFCAEWLDPIFCAGHWLPEMVSIAGGEERLGRNHTESVRIEWQAVREYDPEVIVLTPCGFDAAGALEEAHWLTSRDGWADLSAVRTGDVFVVNANAYFARPGPRLIDGTEILARLIQPGLFSQPLGPDVAFRLTLGSTNDFEPFV